MYVGKCQELLRDVAAPGELVIRPVQPAIWRERGGWADDIHWPAVGDADGSADNRMDSRVSGPLLHHP